MEQLQMREIIATNKMKIDMCPRWNPDLLVEADATGMTLQPCVLLVSSEHVIWRK
jgi:hypothetical protein